MTLSSRQINDNRLRGGLMQRELRQVRFTSQASVAPQDQESY